MEVENLALLAGILFILIAVVGGGFSIKEVTIPRVPGWARIVALLAGVLFVAPFFVGRYGTAPPGTAGSGLPGMQPIYVDTQPDRSAHNLELNRLEVRSAHHPPRVNDRVEVSFTLKNVGTAPIAFQETFVAARSPGTENRDFGHGHERLTLGPNETVLVKANMIADAPGVWQFWPCYILQGGSEEDYCPSRWRAFPVSIVENP